MPYLESNAWNPECKTALDSLAFVCTAERMSFSPKRLDRIKVINLRQALMLCNK